MPQPIRTRHAIEFSGRAGEYFRIWIVNISLSILTLGIYSAWAKVRSNRYFYANTHLDGAAFEYTADPVKILKGRLLAVAVLIAFQVLGQFYPAAGGFGLLALALLAPALVVMSMRFRLRNSRWRGIRFNFAPDWKAAYALFLPVMLYFAVLAVAPLWLGIDPALIEPGKEIDENTLDAVTAEVAQTYLTLTAAGVALAALAFPWWHHRYYRFLGNRAGFGRQRFRYIGNAMEFYALYFLALIIFVVVLFLVSALIAVLAGAGHIEGSGLLAILGVIALLLLPYALAMAQIQTARTNVVYNNLELGDLHVRSALELKRMVYLYLSNTLAIILSLGLAIPWARIRMARYRAQTLTLTAVGFDHFLRQADEDNAAYGEEMADVFGWDIGL